MGSVKLSKEEMVMHLKKQLSAIEQFCKIYDENNHYIAADIAVKMRVIFHNTPDSKSLLSQLKLTHLPIFCGCDKYNSKNLATHLGLIGMEHKLGMSWRYVPKLKIEDLKLVNQENWWNSKKIIVDSNKVSYTRGKIIKAMANKDGGAHVDDSLDLDIYNLTRSTSSGWVNVTENGDHLPMNPVPPSIRQMAFEVLETFRTVNIWNESKLH